MPLSGQTISRFQVIAFAQIRPDRLIADIQCSKTKRFVRHGSGLSRRRQAIDRVAQTSLREMIGSSMLAALLSERKAADEQLRDEIGNKTAGWGVSVTSVEIRDVAIPVALQDAMSRQAQAEREKQARVILGSAEAEIAGKFVEAAKIYAEHPAALQLRAMNIIYETTKERGTTILIPTSMVDSMNPASALVLAGQRAPGDGFPSLKSVA